MWLQGDHLPGESDLKEEGHSSVKGAGGARDTVIPIGEADVEWHRRAGGWRGGRGGSLMLRVDKGFR